MTERYIKATPLGPMNTIQFFVVALCLVVIIISYVVIAIKIYYYRTDQALINAKDMLTLPVLGVIILIFFLSTLCPFIAVLLPRQKLFVHRLIWIQFFTIMIYFQSALNPIVFLISNRSFRKFIKKLFRINQINIGS